MPGGVGYYLGDKFILFLSEDSKTTLHKGINYPFQLFYGVFFPIVKLKHNAVIAKFQFLENHPVKKEWLYIPAENENFEDEVRLVLREVLRKNPLFGIPVKETAAEKRARENADEIIDTRKPSLFNTDAPKQKPQPKPKPAAKSKAPGKKPKENQKAINELLLNIAKRRN
ncbi:hypothetical protein CIK05_13480 [Bdellovibrio sp. qaytius]|nr:hypothetical protein CIK05_13480 [Bdellovibrio sp. qaytius]